MSPLQLGSRRPVPHHLRRRLHPLAVAALVIIGAAAITFYAFNQGLPLAHRFTLHATVANGYNVRGGDPVRIAGIDVGRVSAVSPDGDDTSIEFTLGRDALPIHRDATIRIRDRLFLEGSYYLELDPGTPGTPDLHDGATIALSRTSGPVQFYQLLSTFDRPTRAALVNLLGALNQGFAEGGASGLKEAAPTLQPLESDTARVARAFRGTGLGDLSRLLGSGTAVSGTLAHSSTQLAELVSGLDQTAGALASSDGSLARTISGLDFTLRAAPPALSAIDRALPPTASLARALDPSLRVTPPILEALGATVRQLAGVLAPGRRGPLVASLQATFEQLPAILTQLASAFPIGRAVTDCLRTHVLPVLGSTVPDGSLSTHESVLQDFLHFLPGVAGASGSFDANGPYTRYLAGAGTDTLSGTIGGQPVFATGPPGGGTIQGARPQWIGDLLPRDFRPDAPCSTQTVPGLSSPTAAPDLAPGGGGLSARGRVGGTP